MEKYEKMSGELEEKAVMAAHEAYAKTTGGLLDGNPMANAIRAYLAASPSPSMEMGVVGYFNWSELHQKDYFDKTARGVSPKALVTLSSAQSALAAMRAERDEALRLAGEDVDALQAIGEEFGIEPGEHRVTGARRLLTEFRAQVLRLTEENEALRKERDAAADRAKVWEYNWQQEVKVKGEVVGWCKGYQARIKALEEVLRPFADTPDDWTVDHVNAARSALKENAL